MTEEKLKMEVIEKKIKNLKAERTNLRRTLTVACDSYFKFQIYDDKEVAYEKVLDKSDRLFGVDSQLKSLVEATEVEFDVEESYRDKVIAVKFDFKRCSRMLPGDITVDLNIEIPKIDLNEVEGEEHRVFEESTSVLIERGFQNGHKRKVRALLDDGSHRSYIEESLTDDLKLVSSGREVLSHRLFEGGQTEEAEHERYKVGLQNLKEGFSCEVAGLDRPIICANLDGRLLAELPGRGITLTDVEPEKPPIQMLLGADTLGRSLPGRIEVLRSGILAIETGFGWSVMGAQNKRYAGKMKFLSFQRNEVPILWSPMKIGSKDPLEKETRKGFTSPAMLMTELLLQEIWRRKMARDVLIPENLLAKYEIWSRDLRFDVLLDPVCVKRINWPLAGIKGLCHKMDDGERVVELQVNDKLVRPMQSVSIGVEFGFFDLVLEFSFEL